MRIAVEGRCRNWEDVYRLLATRIVRPANSNGPAAGMAYHDKLWEERAWAREHWDALAKSDRRFLERDGYLEVQVCETDRSRRLRRKPLPAGRPKQSETRERRLTIRLSDEEQAHVLTASKRESCDPSEIVRRALKAYFQTR